MGCGSAFRPLLGRVGHGRKVIGTDHQPRPTRNNDHPPHGRAGSHDQHRVLDLDDGFPALSGSLIKADAGIESPVDLVWASSSLHHVAHPARRGPGRVELAALPRFLRHPREALLEQRCHAAAAAEGWSHHPNWTPVIEAAGFGVTQSELTAVAPVTPAAREYAQHWFARFSHLPALTSDDRDAVKDLLERFPDDVELEPRATRTVWVASPDQAAALR